MDEPKNDYKAAPVVPETSGAPGTGRPRVRVTGIRSAADDEARELVEGLNLPPPRPAPGPRGQIFAAPRRRKRAA